MEPAPLKEDLNSKEYYNKPSQTNKPNNDIFNVNDFLLKKINKIWILLIIIKMLHLWEMINLLSHFLIIHYLQ